MSIIVMNLAIQAFNQAASPNKTSFFDWEAPWCLYRFAIWLFFVVLSWVILRPTFRRSLKKDPELMPTTAMGSFLALVWLLSTLSFSFIFAYVGGELVLRNSDYRLFPAGWRWLNMNWPWFLTALVGVAGFVLIKLLVRRRAES